MQAGWHSMQAQPQQQVLLRQHRGLAAAGAGPVARQPVAWPSLRRQRRRLACSAQQQRQQDKRTTQAECRSPPSTLSSGGSRASPAAKDAVEEEQGWRLFDWAAYQQAWEVPWGAGTTATTMAVWVVAFAGTAFLAMPAVYSALAGKPLWELPPAGQADFALWSEIAECVVTFGILASVAARHRPEVAQQRLFNFSLARPFARGTGWLAWGLIGVAAAPLVVGAAALGLSAVGYDAATSGGRGTVDGVAGMITMDAPTYVRLLSVTGVLAPLLEETLFRGFLLTSLTRIMPVWAAVVASSTAFGIAHLSVRDLPVLIALGCWLGAIYCRSRNLLTPILVHGAWNSSVLSLLFWLTANGVDVEKLLRDNAF